MRIHVLLPNGQEQTVEAGLQGSVMTAMRDSGVPVRAECGGAMACGTCHVHVQNAWIEQVGAQSDEESDLLDESDYHGDASRLSCQIDCTDALDGVKLALQLDSLED